MIIIDTSIWVEFLRGNESYFDEMDILLSQNDVLALSPIFGELLQGAKNNAERAFIIEFWNNLPRINEEDLFIRAGAESGRNKWDSKGVGLIDSFIILAARETVSFVWSLDKNLLHLLKKEEKHSPTR